MEGFEFETFRFEKFELCQKITDGLDSHYRSVIPWHQNQAYLFFCLKSEVVIFDHDKYKIYILVERNYNKNMIYIISEIL